MGVIGARECRLPSGEGYVVRSARGPDGPALAAAWREIIPTTEMVLTSPGEFTLSDQEESNLLEQWAASATAAMIGAFRGSEVLGILGLVAQRYRRTAHVVDLGMSVREAYRGQGVGTALMAAAVDYATRNPWIERITLGVFSHNDAGLALYNKFGFQVEGYRLGQARYEDGRSADEVLMALRVKPRPASSPESERHPSLFRGAF